MTTRVRSSRCKKKWDCNICVAAHLIWVYVFSQMQKKRFSHDTAQVSQLIEQNLKLLLFLYIAGTGQPHYNAIFGVHENRPCYK